MNKDTNELIKCATCGKETKKYALVGKYKALRERKYCSRKCLSKFSRMKHAKSSEEIKRKAEYDKIYRANPINRERKKISQKRYYYRYKGKIKIRNSIYMKKYIEKNREFIKKQQKVYRKNNMSKTRERLCLFHSFGSTRLPICIKKQYAIYHLSRRLLGCGHTMKIEKLEIPAILNQINKGVTHVAY